MTKKKETVRITKREGFRKGVERPRERERKCVYVFKRKSIYATNPFV